MGRFLTVSVWVLLCSTINLLICSQETEKHPDSWDVNTQKGIMRGQSLNLRKIEHPTNKLHTCYEIKCEGSHCPESPNESTIRVCYPAIIITGLPKCATSAMYDLLSKFPGAITMHEKENCPFMRRRAHWLYFETLPRFEKVESNSIIVDGCIDVVNNMRIRPILHDPATYYIVMIRDYPDMLWSSYNFWCKREYDNLNCDYSKWTDPEVHIRSPEIFHDLIIADANGTEVIQPFYYPMHKPCINAGGYYSECIDFHLKRINLMNYTIIISAEELEFFPLHVAYKISKIINVKINDLDVSNFTAVRINTQENKGTNHAINIRDYKPGRYKISGYKPMLEKTRVFLNECWKHDCLVISQYTSYQYTACHEVKTNGQSESRKEIRRFASRVSMPWEW